MSDNAAVILAKALDDLMRRVVALEKATAPKVVPALGHPTDLDWPGDFDQENGRYLNTCCECKKEFVGLKGRVVCRKCVSDKVAAPDQNCPARRGIWSCPFLRDGRPDMSDPKPPPDAEGPRLGRCSMLGDAASGKGQGQEANVSQPARLCQGESAHPTEEPPF